MTILVPPAVLNEVQAVFYLPVAANGRLEFRGRHGFGSQAGDEIAAFIGEKLTLGRPHLAIDPDGNAAVGNVQTLPDILGVVQVDPKPASFVMGPLFSVVLWAHRLGETSAKQVFNASSTSGWFALTWNR